MGATRRDVSGVFDAELRRPRTQRVSVLPKNFHLNHHGITFVSDTPLPVWTEVVADIRLPALGGGQEPPITCRAVVVQCDRRAPGRGFTVALLFFDLPKNEQLRLDFLPVTHNSASVSLSR